MRSALARTLYELAKEDDRIVVVVADISPAGAMDDLRREFPARFINVGVAEQSMIGLAAGLAQRGFRPFCYTIAPFALFRPYEFIRCDLAYQRLPVTIVGMGAGLSYSTLGGTHQAIEDVAVAMACPEMTVLAPCDPAETEACVRWCASRESGGPVYLRIGKSGEPDLTSSGIDEWSFGRLRWLGRAIPASGDVCLLTYGPIASLACEAALRLRAGGLVASVVVSHTLSPLHETNIIEKVLRNWDDVVIVEEASGAPLAKEVHRLLAEDTGVKIHSFSLPGSFPHMHGTRQDLLEHAGLTVEKIVAALS